jgi:hypothetical protein
VVEREVVDAPTGRCSLYLEIRLLIEKGVLMTILISQSSLR